MKTFRELKFWDRMHRLVIRVHEATKDFPREELVNLTANMRRTATSIASAMAESMALSSDRESINLVQGAIGTTGQLEYQVLLAHDLGYIDDTWYDELTNETLELRRQLISHLMKLRTIR